MAQVVNAALGNRARFNEMQAFFGGVGTGYTAGVWQDSPQDHPQFRERYVGMLAKRAAKRKSEEMV